MRAFPSILGLVVSIGAGLLAGCSTADKTPDVTGGIRDSLKRSGFKDVSVAQDRDKGVVTLKGSVASDAGKAQAESIAKSIAAGQVVANEIAVLPPGAEGITKTVNSDLDDGIKKNLDAALVARRLDHGVKYDVKNGVVTLTGTVLSPSRRASVESAAAAVPNVRQVVDTIDVKNQKATSTP